MTDRRELTRQYKQTPRPAGMYVVRNRENGRWLVGSSPDVPGMLNRQRSQLEWGGHPDKELQHDWNELGPDAFEFDTLDLLEAPDDPAWNPKDDLRVLREMWLERLAESGQALYPFSLRGK